MLKPASVSLYGLALLPSGSIAIGATGAVLVSRALKS